MAPKDPFLHNLVKGLGVYGFRVLGVALQHAHRAAGNGTGLMDLKGCRSFLKLGGTFKGVYTGFTRVNRRIYIRLKA